MLRPLPRRPARTGLVPCAGRTAGLLLARGDFEVDGGADLGVEPDPDLVRAYGLDRVTDLDRAPVRFGPARLAHGGRDVGGADGTEQPAVAARPPPHPPLPPLQPGR